MKQDARFIPLIERFMEQVDAPECWIWKGVIGNTGYGSLRVKDKNNSTHRLSWELFHGPIPNGLFVLHTCDNKRCVNPQHLFLGTQLANRRDSITKGRSRKGAILTEDLVAALRREARGKRRFTYTGIGRQLGASSTIIRNAVIGKKWQMVKALPAPKYTLGRI